MKNKLNTAIKKLLFCICLFICFWSVAVKFQTWVKNDGLDTLLYAAGFEATSNSSLSAKNSQPEPPSFEKSVELINSGENEGIPLDNIVLDEGGIIPYREYQIPAISEEPDPNRENLPVQEIIAGGGVQIDNFFVKDYTDGATDLAAELLEPSSVSPQLNGEVEVLIYHTHTSEAYKENYTGFYYTDEALRTENRDMSVVAAGEELKRVLEEYGIGVVHDKTVNDEIYNGSYSRSWEVLQKNLEQYPNIQVTIDVHRDSMTTDEGVKYKPTSEIDGRKSAQVMLIAGCDAYAEMDFPHWRENLRFALRIQQKGAEMYPGLMRPMAFSYSKYNMNATTGSILAEIGTDVTTVAEAKYAGRLLGKVIAETLKDLK